MQITNILRDVREDLGNGRTYLPKQDLALVGVTLQTLESGELDPQDGALAELIRFEAARAMGWYDKGLQLIPLLDRRSAACRDPQWLASSPELLQHDLVRTLDRHARARLAADVEEGASSRAVARQGALRLPARRRPAQPRI